MRKKRKIQKKITLISSNGQTIFDGKITDFKIDEELIIEKSIEFFNDKTPCFIHRSAVINRLIMELEDFFESDSRTNTLNWDWEQLPEYIRMILKTGDGVKTVIYSDYGDNQKQV